MRWPASPEGRDARDRVVRLALWATAPANFAVAGLVLAPTSALGEAAGLPAPAPALVYRALLALFLALFGGAYAWLACQPVIDRPLVGLAAIGKTAAFTLTFALWLAGAASGRWVFLLAGDLPFAAVFVWWLWGGERPSPGVRSLHGCAPSRKSRGR
jgi:hypothetical protein